MDGKVTNQNLGGIWDFGETIGNTPYQPSVVPEGDENKGLGKINKDLAKTIFHISTKGFQGVGKHQQWEVRNIGSDLGVIGRNVGQRIGTK